MKSQIFHSIKVIFESRFLKFRIEIKRLKKDAKEVRESTKQRKTILTQARPQFTVEGEKLVRRQNARASPADPHSDSPIVAPQSDPSHRGGMNSNMTLSKNDLSQENKQLKNITKALDKVMSNFQKMGEIVTLHDEMFSDIEMNTSVSQANIEKGKKTLHLIYQDVSSNRSLIFKIFAIVTLIAVIFILMK